MSEPVHHRAAPEPAAPAPEPRITGRLTAPRRWRTGDTPALLATTSGARIDLLVIDGPPLKSHRLARYPAVPLLWERLGERAVIILDDARCAGERAIVQRWLDEHPDLRLEWVNALKGLAILRRVGQIS